jgi:hypothetical protein
MKLLSDPKCGGLSSPKNFGTSQVLTTSETKFREKVVADRADNEEAAAQGRNGPQPADNDESGEDYDDEDEMDPKLY